MRSPSVPSISPREASERLAAAPAPPVDGAPLLVDVRERHEFGMLRVPGSVLMPLSEFAARYEALPRDRPLLMLCAGGFRSANATDHLLRAGYPEVHNVVGGITAWQAAGLPVRSGPVGQGEGDLPTPGG